MKNTNEIQNAFELNNRPLDPLELSKVVSAL